MSKTIPDPGSTMFYPKRSIQGRAHEHFGFQNVLNVETKKGCNTRLHQTHVQKDGPFSKHKLDDTSPIPEPLATSQECQQPGANKLCHTRLRLVQRCKKWCNNGSVPMMKWDFYQFEHGQKYLEGLSLSKYSSTKFFHKHSKA